jgi:hypothetical protein
MQLQLCAQIGYFGISPLILLTGSGYTESYSFILFVLAFGEPRSPLGSVAELCFQLPSLRYICRLQIVLQPKPVPPSSLTPFVCV